MRSKRGRLRLFMPMALAIMALAFQGLGCTEKSENSGPCDDTEMDEIEPYFRIHFLVDYANGDPYLGKAYFYIQKHYCDGHISPKTPFVDSVITMADGHWRPTILPQFKLANEEDFIRVQFGAEGLWYVYDYYDADVREAMILDPDYLYLVLEDTIRVILEE